MENIVIVHFQPLEKYPPITNLLDYLSNATDKKNITIFSTKLVNKNEEILYSNGKVNIIRLNGVHAKSGVLKLLQYLVLYLKIFFKIIQLKPKSILYYETLSALPVYWYKRIVKKCNVLIHYHEYTSPEEHISSSPIAKYIHSKEQKLYPKSLWISHTNQKRLSLFLEDESLEFNSDRHRVMPNYPSKKWSDIIHNTNNSINEQVKFIYVGALGLETMYLREFAEFVVNQKGKVIWDIYTNQFDGAAVNYLKNLGSDWIRLCGEVNYYDIPYLINKENYNIGLILYKGHIKNYIYNAPNKLFEYLACKLNVWYPSVMEGCKEYATTTSYPLVFQVDFSADIADSLNQYNSYLKIVKENTKTNFCYEDIYNEIVSVL